MWRNGVWGVGRKGTQWGESMRGHGNAMGRGGIAAPRQGPETSPKATGTKNSRTERLSGSLHRMTGDAGAPQMANFAPKNHVRGSEGP